MQAQHLEISLALCPEGCVSRLGLDALALDDDTILNQDEKDPKVKEQWLAERKAELKKSGAKTLLEAIRAAESRQIGSEEAAKAFTMECAYFRKHEEHMNYDRNQERGVPIGSGAMESQCSQNQNRFKLRGQFWSEDGFSAASKAYVRYTNDELKYCYRRKAA